MKTEIKNWLKRRIGYKNKPKIVVKHRERKRDWSVCECPCKCTGDTKWTDYLCIQCFLGRHRNSYIEPKEDRK